MTRTKIILILASILISFSCNKQAVKEQIHKIKFIKVSDKVNLELLDWGGTGTPMFFLTGMGNSAHVFDEFAPRFTDKFHVYALTRRGFGASSQPKDGYNLATLSQDIISVIDHLHLKKVILVGHSIASEEITKIAGDHPGKIEKIVYIDAAYDRTELSKIFTLMPQFPAPKSSDSASIEAVSRYEKRVNGISMPHEELKQVMIFSKEGKLLKSVTPDSISGAMISIVVKPDYKKIKCPSLAIYAKFNKVKDIFAFYDTSDSLKNKSKAKQLFQLMIRFTTESPALFLKESKNGIVKKIKGHHYLFLSNPDETEKLMRDFL